MVARSFGPPAALTEDEDDEEATAASPRLEETKVVFTRLAGLEEEEPEEDEGRTVCLFTRLRKSTSPTLLAEAGGAEAKSAPVRWTRKRTQLISSNKPKF